MGFCKSINLDNRSYVPIKKDRREPILFYGMIIDIFYEHTKFFDLKTWCYRFFLN